ncbi:uncharacterized protein DS421_20g679450 [Arachis hypogaea]|nr:uncharacterized protein DS421_20g679450 [Arachis hypogaea]
MLSFLLSSSSETDNIAEYRLLLCITGNPTEAVVDKSMKNSPEALDTLEDLCIFPWREKFY